MAQVLPGHLCHLQTHKWHKCYLATWAWLRPCRSPSVGSSADRHVSYKDSASTAVVLYQPPLASDLQPDPTKSCKHEQWCHLFRDRIRQNGDPGSVHHRANSSNNDRSFKDQRISISGISRRRRRPSAFSDVWPIRRRYILVVFTSNILFQPSFTSLCL